MKILQVITTLLMGGAEKLIVDMVPMYQVQGHQVDVLLFDGTETPFRKQLEEKGVKIYELGRGKSVYSPSFIFKLIPFLKKYDIVHTHNTAPQLFAAIGSVLCSVVLVTTEHNTSNRRRDWKWYAWVDKWMYSRYKKVICISDKTKEHLCQFVPGVKPKTEVIYNGINVGSYAKATPLVKTESGSRKVLAMVAGFRYQKDQDTVVRALSLLSKGKFELWLIGDGERRNILETLVEQLGLSEYVKFWGIRSDVPQLLQSSDIVVMSSHWEGFGLAAVEGMAAGKPVVASDIPGVAQVVEGAGILFPHEDAQQLAVEIERLVEDKTYYSQVADACRKRADEYDISKMVEGYIRVYNEVVVK